MGRRIVYQKGSESLKVAIFIPTYNRPLLFDFLLFTIKKYLKGDYDIISYQRCDIIDYKSYYKDVNVKYDVKVIEQKEPAQKELKSILKYICQRYDFIITFTDDALLYREVNLEDIISIFNEDVFSYSFRLSKRFFDDINCDNISINSNADKYKISYKDIIDKNDGNINFDGKGAISHFTYPFELSSSMYRTDKFLHVIYNSSCDSVWSLEYTGRIFVVKNFDEFILVDETAQSISIQWNGMIAGENKIISDSELDEITMLKVKSCDYEFDNNCNFVEELKDCFITYISEKKYIKMFYNILKNRRWE